jgi:hypothetical protein
MLKLLMGQSGDGELNQLRLRLNSIPARREILSKRALWTESRLSQAGWFCQPGFFETWRSIGTAQFILRNPTGELDDTCELASVDVGDVGSLGVARRAA